MSLHPSPKVSIVLCGYNQAKFVQHAVASALGQTYGDIELIIVDNGSTDGSRELVETYRSDPRVRLLLHAENAAPSKRLNEAIALSSGDYVSILYADDYYLPHKLARQVEAFSTLTPDYGVVYSPGYRLNADTGRQWVNRSLKASGFVLKAMLDGRHDGFVNPISPLVRRECFIRYPFYEDLFAEGESVYWRIAMKYRFHYLDEPLVVMREHPGNIGKAVKLNADMVLSVYERLAREPEFPPELLHDLRTLRGDFIGGCAWLGIRIAADPTWARRCALSAIRWQPRHFFRPRLLATLALCTLPAGAIRAINRALNRLRDQKETIVFKTDYSQGA